MKSLKSLIPSLLLIIIYLIADVCFGPLIGIIVTLILGAAEFIYTYVTEKYCDKMILGTTLFFCLPGIITLYAEGTLLARLEPVFIEVLFCVLTGIFAFSKADPTQGLPASYRKQMHLNASQLQSVRHMFRNLFYLTAGHTLLSAVSLLFLPESASSFISGPLLYILIALFFVGNIIRNRRAAARYKKEEWLPIVNEKGEIKGQAPRSVCHSGSKLLHPVVHLHILNARHEIFLQKRSMTKKLLPGKWDTAVGGHVSMHESIEDALKRETFEELGITRFKVEMLGHYVWESPIEKELVFSFVCQEYDHIHIDNDEVDDGRFWSASDLRQGIASGDLTPNFVHEYHLLVEPYLKKRRAVR